MTLERLQKILARAGVASRRACEELVAAGRVTVDGRAVTELGAKADPETQEVRLDGRRVRSESLQYWMLNKPKGVVCTHDDPAGRSRPLDFIPDAQARLFPVGRLDADSKGLLLLTNDGALANRLTHPRYEVPKTYQATVAGRITGKEVQRLLKGVHLAEAKTGRPKVKVLKRSRSRSLIQVTIFEGRNRQVRRMLARLGHPVRELVRTRIGRLSLRGLGPGRARRLTPAEVEYLKELPDADPAGGGTTRGKRRTKHGAGQDRTSRADKASARSGASQRSRESTKRSTDTHDPDGTGKTRRNQRRHPDGGQRRGRGPGNRSPARGRRPRGDPPK